MPGNLALGPPDLASMSMDQDFPGKITHSRHSDRSGERVNARNVGCFTLYGGQLTFSTQLLTLNYLLYSPTNAAPVSLETYPLYSPFSFISIVQWSVEEENTKMSKVAKGKGKTHGKNRKTGKFATEQTMNRQTAFKITIRGDC